MLKNQGFIGEHTIEYLKSLKAPFKATQPSIKKLFIIPDIKKVHFDSKLNPDYNFGNYVEGECNMLARSAGIVVGNNPGGTTFNPFIVCGDSGLGKTHLAHAIGLLVKEKHPEKTVLYVNANKFRNQFIESVRNNMRNEFLHFYKTIDVLILDDINIFAGKGRTQDIFFDIFSHLHQSGKQLILTSDKPPAELKGIGQRLLIALKQGLQADLQRPDHETRLTILKKKAYHYRLELPDELLEFLAVNSTKNIRELEEVITSLYIQSTLNRKAITLDLARQMVENLISTSKREITIEHIQQIVCDYYKIPNENIQSKTRKREIVQARQVSMFFSKRLTKATLASIGSQIGGKDHATVLHACKTVYKLIEEDEQFSNQIKDLEKRLKLLIY
jgi:chromosomal replication initiator protein